MNLLLVLVSALLYVLSFPIWNWGVAAFIALAPLFGAAVRTRSTARAMAWGGLWGGLIALGMGYWLYPTLTNHFNVWPPKAALFFLLCVILPCCLIYGGILFVYRFVRRDHVACDLLVLPALWTLGEYLKEAVPILLPWGAIGYAVLPFTRFVQIADVAGVHGVTFVVALINALLFLLWRRVFAGIKAGRGAAEHREMIPWRKKTMTIVLPALWLMIVLSAPLIYGMFRLQGLEADVDRKIDAGGGVDAVVVQGNFSLHERWSGMGFYHRLQTYVEMSAERDGPILPDIEEGAAEETKMSAAMKTRDRVIVWPETTLNQPAYMDDRLFGHIMDVVGENALLISGGLMQDNATGRTMNSAYLIAGAGMLTRYDKNILLPYAETSSMIDWLERYYTAPDEFASGGTPPCVETPHGRVGVSICFEILYPRYIAGSSASGAQVLVNMSNDGWFGDSAMPHMHLNAARMRAIENRRFLLRAANNGISAVIAPDGSVMSQTRLFQRQRIDGEFVCLDMMSPYIRFGDWLIVFSALILATALVSAIIKE